MATGLCVRLSRWCIVPKQLSRSLCDLHQIEAPAILFSHTKHEPDILRGFHSLKALNVGNTIWIRYSHSYVATSGEYVRTSVGRHVSYSWGSCIFPINCCTSKRGWPEYQQLVEFLAGAGSALRFRGWMSKCWFATSTSGHSNLTKAASNRDPRKLVLERNGLISRQ